MKTAIVTGAFGNLGQAVVQKFLVEGYHVIGTRIPNEPLGVEFTDHEFESAIVDLGNEELAGEFVGSSIARHQKIDVAVLTAGGFAMGDIEKTGITDINKQFRLNFETAYNVARPLFLQMMKQEEGRIFLIGSRPGSDMHKSKGMVAYGLAKSLLFRLAELMNEEAKSKNVVTSVIIPSTIDTPQNRKSMPDADPSKWVSPESIADAIYFYSSPEGGVLGEPIIKAFGFS